MHHARKIYKNPGLITWDNYVMEDRGDYLMVNRSLYFRAHNDWYLEKFFGAARK